MTISSISIARKSYTGNGATTVFAGPPAVEAAHLIVKLFNTTTGIMGDPLDINVDYTVTGAGTIATGQARPDTSITMAVAPTASQVLYIDLSPPLLQEQQYPEAGSFPALAHAEALDLVAMRLQAIQLLLRRAILLPDGNAFLDFVVDADPAERRGKTIAFDDDTAALPSLAELSVSSFHFVTGAPSSGLGKNGDVAIDDASWNVYYKVSGAWTLRGQIEGPTGDPGNQWYSGAGVPSDATGIDGDMYFRTSNSDIYQKAAGTWGSPIANIQGASGAGTGDVVGPAGVTDGRIALFDGATGKLIKQHTGAPGALAVLNTVDTAQIDDEAITLAKIAAAALATAAEIADNTADKIITTDEAWTAAEPEAVAYAGSWAPDLDDGNFQTMTLTGALNMGSPTNAKAGQPVVIVLEQDGTGGRAITLPSEFELGSFTPSTAANAVDVIAGIVLDTSPLRIVGSYKAGV